MEHLSSSSEEEALQLSSHEGSGDRMPDVAKSKGSQSVKEVTETFTAAATQKRKKGTSRIRRKAVQVPAQKTKDPKKWGMHISRTLWERIRPDVEVVNTQGRVNLKKGWAFYLGEELSKTHVCPFVADQGHIQRKGGKRGGCFLFALLKCTVCGFQITCRILVSRIVHMIEISGC